MAEKLVTIATYADPIAANLAKIKLASEEIDCFLLDENAVATYGWIAGLIKIQLQVRQSDAEKATEILSREPVETEPEGPEDEDASQGPEGEDSPEEPQDEDSPEEPQDR